MQIHSKYSFRADNPNKPEDYDVVLSCFFQVHLLYQNWMILLLNNDNKSNITVPV